MSEVNVKRVTPQKFRARHRNQLWLAGIASLVLVVLAHWFFVPYPHRYFTLDGQWWFYPLFGLIPSMMLVVFSRIIGFILKRREGYWEKKS